MPGKKTEVVEKVDDTHIMPDIYESWLGKQKSTHVLAKSGFVGDQKVGRQATAANEDVIDTAQTVSERDKRHLNAKGKR
jgi:hypothetical protein